MNLDNIKATVDEISRSTGIKNPKVLIVELCSVIRILIRQIEEIQTTTHKNELPPPFAPEATMLPPRDRKGNAGDAE